MRIYELARAAGVPTKAVLEKIHGLGDRTMVNPLQKVEKYFGECVITSLRPLDVTSIGRAA